MNYKELESLIKVWAHQKGILDKGNPIAQCKKTFEELDELHEALSFQYLTYTGYQNKKGKWCNTDEEIKDALGDILVTIIIQAELQGLKLEDCLESAYNVIKNRTGRMVGGQFLKDE